jgi:hypothetical protein
VEPFGKRHPLKNAQTLWSQGLNVNEIFRLTAYDLPRSEILFATSMKLAVVSSTI